MSLPDDLRARGDVAFAFATVLEQGLGDDALLTVGLAQDSIGDVLRDDQVRAIMQTVSAGEGGEGAIALVAMQHFAESLERAASDEIFLTATIPALDAAAHALATMSGIQLETDAAVETDLAALTQALGANVVVYPVLDGTDVVACLAIDVGTMVGATATSAQTSVASDAVPVGTPLVLAEVEMGVTAELGRCEMTVRELLSLTPGAVIDLDRAAGAPVDVLVNGTLIARGEVVVIDEEFGIRISEILKHGAPAR